MEDSDTEYAGKEDPFRLDTKAGEIEIVSRINENTGLVCATEEVCKNNVGQKDVNHLKDQLAKGNDNPGIDRKPI